MPFTSQGSSCVTFVILTHERNPFATRFARRSKKSSTDQPSRNDYDPYGPAWDIETLKGYIATVKDNFKPVLSEDAKRLLVAHWKCTRKKVRMDKSEDTGQ